MECVFCTMAHNDSQNKVYFKIKPALNACEHHCSTLDKVDFIFDYGYGPIRIIRIYSLNKNKNFVSSFSYMRFASRM